MNKYQKGARFEREIIRKFWKYGWTAVRSAGSGSIKFPVPDVIAIKDGKILLIECKVTKKDRLNVKKAATELKKFSDIAKCDAYICIKFQKKEPRFYSIDALISKKNYSIGINDKYLSIETIVGEQSLL